MPMMDFASLIPTTRSCRLKHQHSTTLIIYISAWEGGLRSLLQRTSMTREREKYVKAYEIQAQAQIQIYH